MLAWAVTVHKAQGSTYTSMVGDLQAQKHTPIMQGLVYTMLSRATSREGLRLIAFETNKIKVNRSALQEMDRMKESAIFTWSPPLSSIPADCVIVGHLNIRSMQAHHQHLLSEDFLKTMSVLCLTETHVTDDRIQRYSFLPSHSATYKCSPHGLGMLIRSDCTSRQIRCSDSLEIMARCVTCASGPLQIVVVYRPPGAVGNFLHKLRDCLDQLPVTSMPTIVTGDFNMDSHAALVQLMSSFKLYMVQTILKPTHVQGGQLDLVFTSRKEAVPMTPVPVYFTDHFLIWVALTDLSFE